MNKRNINKFSKMKVIKALGNYYYIYPKYNILLLRIHRPIRRKRQYRRLTHNLDYFKKYPRRNIYSILQFSII